MSEEQLYEISEDHRSGFVALVGRPNVGKSTLMNAFMRQKIAAVTHRPQTTRTRQLGIITEPGYQMIFIDTPGIIREPRHELDEYMVQSALETLDDADVILWLVDMGERPGEGDRQIAAQLAEVGGKVILGLNKVDTVSPAEALGRTEAYVSLLRSAEWAHLSALTGDGVAALFDKLVAMLPLGPRYFPADQVTDAFERAIAAELIREQIMLQLREEVPYGTAVRVRDFKEREDGTTYVSADIFVERDSHKGIVIGKGGAQLRALGEAARQQIEELVDGKVFLELWVKVQKDWRRDPNMLKQFGYGSDWMKD
ncbi:MAG: GTPase Era [Anaerolineae bacterium]|nr:GTPase Era [Anaerolineae bacterium]HNS40663.1 GTPase Era [Promineifilum sp.]